MRLPTGLAAIVLGWAAYGCGSAKMSPATDQKIAFDLGQVNADGLVGPPDGLRALSYEFCVPDRPECVAEVQRIDPTVQLMRGARGRIGCGTDEILCLGSTHQPDWRGVLTNLARLPYIQRIAEAHFEH
jgi:hypothetical protein